MRRRVRSIRAARVRRWVAAVFRRDDGYDGRHCPACGWLHIGHVPNVADLTDLEGWFGDLGVVIPEAVGADAVDAVLRNVRGTLVSELRRLVLDEPFMAISFLLDGIGAISFEADIMEEKLVLGVQQVYASDAADTLLATGGSRWWSDSSQPTSRGA